MLFQRPNCPTLEKTVEVKTSWKNRIFSWRACVNGLLVFANMVAQGMQSGCVCPVCGEEPESLRGCLNFYFSSLITPYSIFVTHHSSLITHHLKYPITLHKVYVFGTITQLIIAQIFQLFVGPILVTWCSFYFFLFFFYLQPPIPKLIEPREKKKKKPSQWRPVKEEEKKERKKELSEGQKYYVMKKKKKRKKKGRTNGQERKGRKNRKEERTTEEQWRRKKKKRSKVAADPN